MSAFAEIQVGYTVRSTRNGVTREGVVEAIGPRSAHTQWPVVEIANIEDDSIEIVDRPKPAVTLPTVPTLGWISCGATAHLGHVRLDLNMRGVLLDGLYYGAASTITAFTPATVIPTKALDELRAWEWLDEATLTFLAAVDNASTR